MFSTRFPCKILLYFLFLRPICTLHILHPFNLTTPAIATLGCHHHHHHHHHLVVPRLYHSFAWFPYYIGHPCSIGIDYHPEQSGRKCQAGGGGAENSPAIYWQSWGFVGVKPSLPCFPKQEFIWQGPKQTDRSFCLPEGRGRVFRVQQLQFR
jgi:hypothetical protein